MTHTQELSPGTSGFNGSRKTPDGTTAKAQCLDKTWRTCKGELELAGASTRHTWAKRSPALSSLLPCYRNRIPDRRFNESTSSNRCVIRETGGWVS